ncbi:MAG: hypothetical protein IKX89_02640 [Firmicutes bacterium]|nr:hypothetical protein [Bacillota bacterium]
MITEKILTALTDIDDEMIADAAPGKQQKGAAFQNAQHGEKTERARRRRGAYRIGALAACLCIVVAVLAVTGPGRSLFSRGGELNFAPSNDTIKEAERDQETAVSNSTKNMASDNTQAQTSGEAQDPELAKIRISDIAAAEDWGEVTFSYEDGASSQYGSGEDAPDTAAVYRAGELLGEYPTISRDEALALLESGEADGFCEVEFPGKDSVVASEYAEASETGPAAGGVISVPVYVFTVRIPEAAAEGYGGGEGKPVYARYCVIAIDPEYLE